MPEAVIYTIGHSTRSLDEFVEILRQYSVKLLADVRTVPRSRHTPQFNSQTLALELSRHDIDYVHLANLGGLRHPIKDSQNLGWRNSSFRGYADYMQTPEFMDGLDGLMELARDKTTAIMCAEAVPWRCHRSMIGDALLARGVKAVDIYNKNKAQDEKLTSFALVEGRHVTYPATGED